MAENNKDNKMIILDILKKSSAPVSGEEISRFLSISRAGVWKHINSLKEHGYEIVSNRNGYFLEKGKDILQKWEFPAYKDRLNFFPEIDSTMKKAKNSALEGAEDRTIIAAEKQTEGIDRKGDKWESEEGGLYFTIILRPEIPLSGYNLITLAAVSGIINYLKDLGIESRCRWPNEVITGGKKISGILTEISGIPDRIDYALVGIGININNESSGISVKEILKKEIHRKTALNNLLENIFSIIDSGFDNIQNLWNKTPDIFENREIQYRVSNRIIKGKIKSVTRNGNIILSTDSDEEIVITPGDEKTDNTDKELQ